MTWLVTLCLFLTFALSLTVQDGYSFGAAIAFLLAIWVLGQKWWYGLGQRLYAVVRWVYHWRCLHWFRLLSRADQILIFTFTAYALGMFSLVAMDGWHTRELDRPSRFLLAVPVLLLLMRVPFRREWLWYGVILGALASFSVAYYERFVLGKARADGGLVAIMFGDIAMLLGMLSLVAMIWAFATKRRWIVALALAAAFAGIAASLLSGSRGGWVMLPILLLFFFWQAWPLLGKIRSVALATSLVIGLIVAIATPQTGVKARIQQAVNEVKAYSQGQGKNTSVGVRFEMWRGSYYLFKTAPVFGVGEYAGRGKKQDLVKQGIITPTAAHFDHAHNEYFDALALRGLFGFILLMAVYLVPLRLFLSKMHQYPDNWNIKAYAMAGALIPMCYMDFALTQAMFSHNSGVMMYVFPIIYYWAAVRWAERVQNEIG